MSSTGPDQRWRDPHPQDSAAHGVEGGTRGASAKAAARAVGRGATATARGARRAGRFAFTTARRAADAQGAAASGLNRLIEMHAFNTAGDAAVAISLAGSLFFSMPGSGGESSRSHVALFLGLTMLPFAIVAPLLGPFLDRFAHGRRWAIGATMGIRAFLCWILADAITSESAAMFPSALGVLVMSKAYGVTRAAAVPRLIPEGFTLVKANGRVSMSGIVGVSVSAPIAGLCTLAGADWVLRYATVLFIVATVLAIRLPGKVDSSQGEGTLSFTGDGATSEARERAREEDTQPIARATSAPRRTRRPRVRIPHSVAFALRANCAPKWLYGFLLMFMSFLLQEHPINGWSPTLLLGIVAGGAGAGNLLGVVAASLLKRIKPQVTVSVVMVVDAAAVLVGALFYGILTLAVIGLVAGAGQALAKFSLDSTIQRDVPERVQTSAFARSDTTLQLAWVVGGFVGIGLPLNARLGLWVAFAVLAAWAFYVLASPRPRVAVDQA
ncbi:MFS transporter [Nocardioides cheoyonin]|uniref:MFS transporter n=1 Tax=Nocardioides cheoyonin TaxID=3156615 RepID=UPI0032B4411D